LYPISAGRFPLLKISFIGDNGLCFENFVLSPIMITASEAAYDLKGKKSVWVVPKKYNRYFFTIPICIKSDSANITQGIS